MGKSSIGEITPGQRYEQRGGFTWRVLRVINFAGEDIPHVQLVSERDPSSTKTLSIDALLDRNLFKVVGDKR